MQTKLVLRGLAALWLLAASAAFGAEPFVPSPSQLYGPLFVRVQMASLRWPTTSPAGGFVCITPAFAQS